MIRESLKAYVAYQRSKGISVDVIRRRLLLYGYTKKQIDLACNMHEIGKRLKQGPLTPKEKVTLVPSKRMQSLIVLLILSGIFLSAPSWLQTTGYATASCMTGVEYVNATCVQGAVLLELGRNTIYDHYLINGKRYPAYSFKTWARFIEEQTPLTIIPEINGMQCPLQQLKVMNCVD